MQLMDWTTVGLQHTSADYWANVEYAEQVGIARNADTTLYGSFIQYIESEKAVRVPTTIKATETLGNIILKTLKTGGLVCSANGDALAVASCKRGQAQRASPCSQTWHHLPPLGLEGDNLITFIIFRVPNKQQRRP